MAAVAGCDYGSAFGVAVEDCEARRVSGRIRLSSSRSRYSTSRSRSRVNINTNVYMSRRPWMGGQTYNSWNSYGRAGYIYGFVYYSRTRHYRNCRTCGLYNISCYMLYFHVHSGVWCVGLLVVTF